MVVIEKRFLGYLAYIREEKGEWKEATLSPEILTYNFENLKCGNVYQVYLVPFASGGKGERSPVLTVKTDGRGKLISLIYKYS